MTRLEIFMNKVKKTDTCWLWIASKNPAGYGRFYNGSKIVMAHRYSYETLVSLIKPGLVIDHLCRNRACVNPDHLEPVTNAENVRRGDSGKANGQRNKIKTHCPYGHAYLDHGYIHIKANGKSARRCNICHKLREQKRRLTKE